MGADLRTMSDLNFNKIAGALLATGLAIVGLRELSSGVFSQEKREDRINVIAYLHAQGGTLAIPAPKPAAAAPAAAAGQPVATGTTATPATGAGGPTGAGPGAPAAQASTKGTPST